MVGLIQKVLVDLILATGGNTALQTIKQKANIPADREFRIDTVYDDNEWQRFLQATLEVLGITYQQAMDAYADAFCKDALKRFPMWFAMSKNSMELLSRQPIIHNSFATGVSDPQARSNIEDKFKIEKHPNKVITHYRSNNKLCGLYKSLAKWIINHYQDKAAISEECCMLNGADGCKIVVEWTELRKSA